MDIIGSIKFYLINNDLNFYQ